MAEKLAFPEANVLDPRWILNEETGKLTYDRIRRVRSRPAQILLVMAEKPCSVDTADRYLRIMADKRRRRDG